jgi:uncharacterized protein YkwD
VALALALTSVVTSAQERAVKTAYASVRGITRSESAFAEQVLALTNQERAKRGLGKVTISAHLSKVARWMAVDMAANHYFAHTDRLGRNVGDRATDFGYDWQMIGENLAGGQRDAGEVVADWMQSPGHRKNLLRPEFREIGIACVTVPGSEYRVYWVQVFAVPR